jgi:hypothetical protein
MFPAPSRSSQVVVIRCFTAILWLVRTNEAAVEISKTMVACDRPSDGRHGVVANAHSLREN